MVRVRLPDRGAMCKHIMAMGSPVAVPACSCIVPVQMFLPCPLCSSLLSMSLDHGRPGRCPLGSVLLDNEEGPATSRLVGLEPPFSRRLRLHHTYCNAGTLSFMAQKAKITRDRLSSGFVGRLLMDGGFNGSVRGLPNRPTRSSEGQLKVAGETETTALSLRLSSSSAEKHCTLASSSAT